MGVPKLLRTIAVGPHSVVVVDAGPAEWGESEVDYWNWAEARVLKVLLVPVLVLVLCPYPCLVRSGILKGQRDPRVLLLMMRWMNGLRIFGGLKNLTGHP